MVKKKESNGWWGPYSFREVLLPGRLEDEEKKVVSSPGIYVWEEEFPALGGRKVVTYVGQSVNMRKRQLAHYMDFIGGGHTLAGKDADPDNPLWIPSYYPKNPKWRENIEVYFDEKQFTSLVSGVFAHLAKIELYFLQKDKSELEELERLYQYKLQPVCTICKPVNEEEKNKSDHLPLREQWRQLNQKGRYKEWRMAEPPSLEWLTRANTARE
jgi:hypothetical protein